MEKLVNKLGKYKYLLLMLAAGLVLILWPSGSADAQTAAASDTATDAEQRLEEVLGAIDGVGRASVLYSEEGVVVVCEGADSARVRLDVVNAVTSYTGFGSDRITVLKMSVARTGTS